MLIFYKFKQKSTMYRIIISSEILGPPSRLGPPRIAGAAGAVVKPLSVGEDKK